MRSWIKNMLSNKEEVSSKRVIGITGSASLITTMVVNSFTHQSLAPSESLVNAVVVISLGALGMTSADKFANKNKQE
jgi:hypothetical protein